MAQTAKAPDNLLIPSPKELDKALTLSADRSRRIAKVFGLKVPGLRLREAEIVDIPFLGALAGGSARRSERRVASHTSEEQRRNAPARAAKNGILAFSASLSRQLRRAVVPRHPTGHLNQVPSAHGCTGGYQKKPKLSRKPPLSP